LPLGGPGDGIGERYLPAPILVIAMTDDPAGEGGLMDERDVLAE
jgi:hypothetical protein